MVMVCKSWIMIDFLILPFEQFSGVQFHQDFAGDSSCYSDLAAFFATCQLGLEDDSVTVKRPKR